MAKATSEIAALHLKHADLSQSRKKAFYRLNAI